MARDRRIIPEWTCWNHTFLLHNWNLRPHLKNIHLELTALSEQADWQNGKGEVYQYGVTYRSVLVNPPSSGPCVALPGSDAFRVVYSDTLTLAIPFTVLMDQY